MLPRRKAQQDSNEKADQVYRYQVREAEKSPVVLMYNVKQNMLLDKQVNFLERSKKMVVNRITVNQKVMFTHYRRKLNAAKMLHARIKGDMELQQDLREQMLNGGRYGLTAEDEDVLRRIWKSRSQSFDAEQQEDGSFNVVRGSRDTSMNLRKSRDSSTADVSRGHIKFQTPRRSSSCVSIHEIRPITPTTATASQEHNMNLVKTSGRIKPTSAVTPRHQNRPSLNRSKSAVPIIKVMDPEGEEEDMVDYDCDQMDELEESMKDQLKINLPEINNGNGNADFKRKETIEPPQYHNKRRHSRANIFIKKKIQDMKTEHLKTEPPDSGRSFFDEEQKGPSLLDIHKKKLENSDVMQRVHTLLDSMAQFSKDRSLIDRDYYTHSVEASAKAGWGSKTRSDSIFNRVSEHERKRAEGNLGIPSMTVKRIRAKTAGNPRTKFPGRA